MAIADLSAYKESLSNPAEQLSLTCAATTAVAGRPYDLWTTAPPVGTAPTTAVAPTNATTGSLGQQDSTTGTLGIVGARFNTLSAGLYLIADRLSHQGGLSGTTITAQTTNLSTAALTRYTSGEGVMIGLTIYTQIGTTGTTVSCSYTNSSGTAGRTSPLVVFGGTGFREASRLILLPLQAGDTGVQSVQSVTVTATTGTAGNFGVTLFKPIYAMLMDQVNGVAVIDFVTGYSGGGIPEVVDGACLFAIAISTSTSIQGGGFILLEEY